MKELINKLMNFLNQEVNLKHFLQHALNKRKDNAKYNLELCPRLKAIEANSKHHSILYWEPSSNDSFYSTSSSSSSTFTNSEWSNTSLFNNLCNSNHLTDPLYNSLLHNIHNTSKWDNLSSSRFDS